MSRWFTGWMCLLFVSACTLRAEDWPQFRGHTGQGLSTEKNLPVEWGPEKNVAWRVPLAGTGWSSPICVGDKYYLTQAVERVDAEVAGYSLRVLCGHTSKGETVWEREVFLEDAKSPKIHAKNSHATPTPLIVGDKLFVHFAHLGTACYDLNGNQLWRYEDHKYRPVHGGGCSPVVVDDLLVFTADGSSEPVVVALETATGKIKWKFARPNDPPKKFAFCTPLVIEVNGQKQIVSPGAGSVSALRPADGTEIWRVNYGDGYSVVPRPIFAYDFVFLSSGFDTPEILAIRPQFEGDVTETQVAWREKRGARLTPSMLVVGEELYTMSDGGVASCFNALTGESHWRERLGGGYSSSPVYADGKIYFQAEDGRGVVVAANKTFTKLAENGFGERTLAPYAICNGAIFIRTEKALYCVRELPAAKE